MDDLNSIANVRNFEDKLENIPSNEIFVRQVMAGFMETCPLELLRDCAYLVLGQRLAELKRAKEGN